MKSKSPPDPLVIKHGSKRLNRVSVDSYNLELKDQGGFLGDRASKKALRKVISEWRGLLDPDQDPFGGPKKKVGKRDIDRALSVDDLAVLGLAESVIEDFAQALKTVISRFLRAKAWRGTQTIVIGGGAKSTRMGAMAVGRAALLLRKERFRVELQLIANHPDDAGLIGTAFLAPAWIFKGFDGLLAIDIGGTNIRAGIVELRTDRQSKLVDASIWRREKWKYKNDDPSRTEALDELARMLVRLIKKAKHKSFRLAPFVGIGCPGFVADDGTIKRGTQNLPGNWSSSSFNLAQEISTRIVKLAGIEPTIVIHNDAVVQGLSEIPRMTSKRWAVMTLGTGLGNARFTNLTK
jgi:predicted NBD/HSP70 family sugar kinase